MRSNSAPAKSRVDAQKLIKTTQAWILESLGAMEATTASLANPEQIPQELHRLREALTAFIHPVPGTQNGCSGVHVITLVPW